MKLIALNTWGGIAYKPLMGFIEQHAQDTDIFCFQELLFGTKAEFTSKLGARVNLFSEIEKLLPDFTVLTYRAPKDALYFQNELLPSGTESGQGIFVHKSLNIVANGGLRTYLGDNPNKGDLGGKITGSCQWVEIQTSKTTRTLVLNLHGLWQRDTHKADTPERFTQSEILQDFLKSKSGKKILCGDFNLKVDGESMQMLAEGMINLIKEYGVISTRSDLYLKPERFGDYILVSQNVAVDTFEALQDEVSDHLPLFLNFQ